MATHAVQNRHAILRPGVIRHIVSEIALLHRLISVHKAVKIAIQSLNIDAFNPSGGDNQILHTRFGQRGSSFSIFLAWPSTSNVFMCKFSKSRQTSLLALSTTTTFMVFSLPPSCKSSAISPRSPMFNYKFYHVDFFLSNFFKIFLAFLQKCVNLV